MTTRKAPPFLAAEADAADANALQAVAIGKADAEQQRRAIRWIVETAAMTYQDLYFPSDRDTAFANGRRFVGLRIVTLVENASKLAGR